MKKVIWSDFASETLKEIFNYYKDIAGRNVANKINSNIFSPLDNWSNIPNLVK